jgi:cell surface protein SprA
MLICVQGWILDKIILLIFATHKLALPNGSTTEARWLQFKIPVSQPENVIGSISDFRSIRFMRMFMTGFNDEVTVRFGAPDLVVEVGDVTPCT